MCYKFLFMFKPFMFKILKLEKNIKHGHVEKCYTSVRKTGMTPTKNVKEHGMP